MSHYMAQQVIYCGRCGAAERNAAFCMAENGEVLEFRLWGRASHSSIVVPPHLPYQRGYQEPPFVLPPQQKIPPDIRKEEIAELKSLLETLASKRQECDRRMEPQLIELESEIAQLAAESDSRQPEEVYFAESGFSREETVLPNAEEEFYDSDYEVLSYFNALHEDFSTVHEESLDRVTYISRSSEFPEKPFDRVIQSTRSSENQEKSSRSDDNSTRSSSLASESIDSSCGFVLDDDFDDDNGYGESPLFKAELDALEAAIYGVKSTEEGDEEATESVIAPSTEEVINFFIYDSTVESNQPEVVNDNSNIVSLNSTMPHFTHASYFNNIPSPRWLINLTDFHRTCHLEIVNLKRGPNLSSIAPALLYYMDKFRSSHRKFVRLKQLNIFISYIFIPLW
ncbi:uncharacterized protein LOC141641748 [Silene latifolia]|uniref:uncharacterized protein LOC141641748 n=1 Tax=Silene latifolia TaxID=37657 RepID=UPI003D77DB73